jgi:hypothetical protein
LFRAHASLALWSPYTERVDPFAWGGPGLERGVIASLFEQTVESKRDQRVQELRLARRRLKKLPEGTDVTLLFGKGTELQHAKREVPGGALQEELVRTIPKGGWFAAVSPAPGNAMLHVNRGPAVELTLRGRLATLRAPMPEKGREVEEGDTHPFRMMTLAWPMDAPMNSEEAMMRAVRYLDAPSEMTIRRGRRLGGPPGLVALEAEDHAVDLVAARSEEPETISIPVRVEGLNDRWSAVLHQRRGYNGAGYYGSGRDRLRTLGLDEQGRAYFPMYTGRSKTDVAAGHPVVASETGEALFIQVTALAGAEPGEARPWHVSVNNPTDESITTTVRKKMRLPGLDLQRREITLDPGERKVLLDDSP